MPEETLLSAARRMVELFRLDIPSGLISRKTMEAFNSLQSQVLIERRLEQKAENEDDLE